MREEKRSKRLEELILFIYHDTTPLYLLPLMRRSIKVEEEEQRKGGVGEYIRKRDLE